MLCKETEKALELFALPMYMLEEFKRYCSLQRDQAPLASLLVYLKRKGSYVQLNQIWRELGPTGGGPFWNQTTLINKLDKLERLEVLMMERRIIPSPRAEAKKKTNTFYRLNPSTPIYPYIYGMLKIYKEEPDKYSSDLLEKPLDHLCDLARKSVGSDPLIGRELVVAMELIGEVFSVGGDEVKRMIKDRMARKGVIKERAKEPIEDMNANHGKAEKRARRSSKKREKKESDSKTLSE